MVEPTTLTLHRSYGCYPHQNCHPLFHILLRPSPPSMANLEPTIVNITNGHPKKKKIQPSATATKRKKISIINITTNHTNPLPSQPKLQTTTTNTKNPNTPIQNFQISDPKLPTQAHKHRKPKSKPKNP